MALIETLTKQPDKEVYKITGGEDNDEVIIGNEKASSFEPHIKFTKWNKENSLSIRYDGISGVPTLSSGQLKLANNEQEFYCLPVEDGLKFGVNFLKKPATNKITFYLEGWEEFNFFYQPPLTEEWKIGDDYRGNIIGLVTETDCLNNKGEPMFHRPENVVGSYAVYHKTKANHILGETNYKIGKFGHYFRPKFIDADNKEIWADLNIKDGLVTITIPQDFLDKAKYPIRANDEFGYHTIGAAHSTQYTYYSPSASYVDATLSSENGGTITKYSLYGYTASGTADIGMAAYTMYEFSPEVYYYAVNRIGTQGTLTVTTTPGWQDTEVVSHTMSTGYAYCVAYSTPSANFEIYYDTGVPYDFGAHNTTATTLPNTWVQGNYYAQIVSIYATYTPSAGAATGILTPRSNYWGDL